MIKFYKTYILGFILFIFSAVNVWGDLSTGLIAHYPFDGNASDMSGNGNHGTVNGATLGADRHGVAGKAYGFDGVDDDVNLGSNANLNPAMSLSVSAWVKVNAIGSWMPIVERYEPNDGKRSYYLSLSNTGISHFTVYHGGGGNNYTSVEPTNSLNLGEWYFLVGTYNKNDGARIYLDGSPEGFTQGNQNIQQTTENTFISGQNSSTHKFFDGSIDEVRIYDRALSATEVASLYALEAELPAGSVTLDKLAPELRNLLDGNGTIEEVLPAGSVIARQSGDPAPAGYTLFQRNEYNATLTWEEKAPVSVARYACDGVEVLGGKIYFVGGCRDGTQTIYDLAERYDPITNQWENLQAMSVGRYGIATSVFNGKLYAIGGRGLSSVEVFDPVTGQWSTGPQLPSIVGSAAAITVNGKILLIGGNDPIAQQGSNQVLELDPSTNQWTQKANMPTARYGMGLVFHENKVWAIGGDDHSASRSKRVEIYDPLNDSWTVGPSLSVERHSPLLWVSNGRIFAAGGLVGGTHLDTIEFLDPVTNQWISSGSLPENKFGAGTAVLNNKVYAIAGRRGSNDFSNKVFAADLPPPASDLYFRDGNATTGTRTSTHELSAGSVTLNMLASETLSLLDVDRTHAQSAGSLLAIPRGEQPPPGCALYKRSDRNGSLVWEEKAPVSVGRHACDGVEVLDGRIYFVTGNVAERYDPRTNQWETLNSTSVNRGGIAASVLHGKIYAIGGRNGATRLSSVEVYDPSTGLWSNGPALPSVTNEATAITVNSKIYLIGGTNSSDQPLNQVLEFDPSTNQWTNKANMPAARAAMKLVWFENRIWAIGSSVVSYDPSTNTWRAETSLPASEASGWKIAWLGNGKIYAAGGHNQEPLDTIVAYDPATQQWESIGTLPEKKHVADAVVLNGKVYVVAGATATTGGSGNSDKVFAADVTPPMDLYYREANGSGTITLDKLATEVRAKLIGNASALAPVGVVSAIDHNDAPPADHGILARADRNATHLWEEMAPASIARTPCDGVDALDGKIYFVGGSDASTTYGRAERYDPATNQWETLSPMSAGRRGIATAVLDGKLYAIGGQGLSSVEIFDPQTGQWSMGPPLPSEVNYGTAVTSEGKILLVGGRNSANQLIGQVLELDPATNQWSQKAVMPTARYGVKLVLFEGKVWAISTHPASAKVEIYDHPTDTWTTGPDLSTARGWPVAWVANERIYVAVGVAESSAYLNSIEAYDAATGQWAAVGFFPENNSASDAVVLDGKVYVVAGKRSVNDWSNKVFAADLIPRRDLFSRIAVAPPLTYDFTQGLVAFYPFDGNASDMSGNGHHGTVIGATLGADRHGAAGKAYSFDGNGDYTIIPNSTDWDFGTSDFTMEFWLKAEPSAENTQGILSKVNDGNILNGWAIWLGSGKVNFRANNDAVEMSSLNDIRGDGLWHHFAIVRNVGTWGLYEDGSQVSQTTSSISITSTLMKLMIGRYYENHDLYYLNGILDDVRIYDRALSAAEVAALYQLESTPPVDPNSDTDGDGFTYAQEIEAGTDPNDAASAPSPDFGLVTHWKLDGSDAGVQQVGVSPGLDRHLNPSGATFFPGNARVIQHPYNTFPTDAFTISYWERATSPRAAVRVSYATAVNENSVFLSDDVLYLQQGSSGGFSIVQDYFSDPYRWKQVTIGWRKSDGMTNIYWDGKLVKEGTYRQGLVTPSLGALCLGQDQDGVNSNSVASSFDQGFVGFLDDFRLYDRVLTPTEVENLYDLEKPTGDQKMKVLVRGVNQYGELGLNKEIIQKTPKTITTGVKAVVSGIYHTLVLKEDGSLWTTGRNHYDQLGDGTNLDRSNLQMIVPSGVESVAACGYHSLFVKSDGSLWGFGYNAHGELGLGDKTNRLTPTRILTHGVKQVISGVYHTLFIKSDGSLWGMGDNRDGQLGNNLKSYYLEPIQINAGEVVSVVGGYYHSAFVKADGSIWSIGKNNYGQLGDGTTTDRSTPVQIESSGVVEVSAGTYQTFYRKADGSLWAVGYNGYGQLGDGTTTNRSTPVQIEASGVVSLADSSYSYVTRYGKSDGSAWAAGYNYFGQLGDGSNIDRNQSVQIAASGVRSVSSGLRFGYILLNTGELKGFGNRSYGRLGDGFPLAHDWTPLDIAEGVRDFEMGALMSSFIKGEGQVLNVGHDDGGLGNGSLETTGKFVSLPNTNASKVAVSHYHSIYLDINGSLWGAGRNGYGELGLGDNIDRNTSVMIEPSGVKDVSVGASHTIFIKDDGSLWAMGANYNGQLGDGSQNNRNQPVQIESSGVVAIATGHWGSYYLKSDGSLWSMGYNEHGQLGIGSTTGTGVKIPTEVVTSGVVTLAASAYNTFFTKDDGSLWGMGNSEPLGKTGERAFPIKLHDSGVVSASIGRHHSSMITSDGSMWVMGSHGLRQWGYTNYFMKVDVFPVIKTDSNTRETAHAVLVPANLPPQRLELNGGEIFENGNAGASVGHVVADDFDQGSKFTYSLVNGVGATHNDLFSIDANGSLDAQQSFDREVNATLSIRVQVMDEANRTLQKTFLIEVLDDPAEDLILPDPEQGLVAHWRFDEKNGSIAYDSSGNGYHAHLRGAGDEAWVENGKVNGAIQLDGLDDYLAIQGLHYSQPGEIQEITIAGWIKTTQADKEGAIISFDRSTFFRLSTGMREQGLFNRPNFSNYLEDRPTSLRGTSGTVATGEWVYIAASRDTSTGVQKVYLNGQLDASKINRIGVGIGRDRKDRFGFIGWGSKANDFDGKRNADRGVTFHGLIDDLRLYHRTLSDAEVASLYNSAVMDSDADGLSDLEESHLGTFANLADSDGDGLLDGEEVKGFHSYEYREGNFTWLEARLDAESRGGYLATITSAEENARAYSAMSGSVNAWLGGLDADFDGNFTWITDEVWLYENWESGQPNNGSAGRLLTFWQGTGDKWHDGESNESSGYILERVFYSDPLMPDTDGDGLLDGEEAKGLEYRSNPMLVDTDGDGRSDHKEIVGIKSYEVIDANFTWEQARDFAKLRGGHLATITSQREQDLINPLVINSNAWLGGFDDNLDGNWEWITGEPWIYQNMGPGQPDNTDGNSTKLNFWSLYPGKWADNKNANLQSYVLERIIKSDPSRAELESPLLPGDRRLDWAELAPAPIAQYLYDGVDVIDGKIYAAGGFGGGYSDQFARYDPATNQWEALPAMSVPRRFMSSAVVDGKFYAIGGKSNASTDLNSTEIFDPVTNSWSPGPSLPRISRSATSVAMDDKIYLIGGHGSSNLDEVLELDPTTLQWTVKASLPNGMVCHASAVWNGKIYVAGGNNNGDLNSTISYDPKANAWTVLPEMNVQRVWSSLFVVGDRLYVAGGSHSSESVFLSSVEVYDPDAKKWVMAGSLPEAKYCSGNAVVGGKIYLFAGRNETVVNNKMFVGEPNRIILDRNEPPSLPSHQDRSYQLATSAENNTSAFVFSATDADANDTLHYFLPPATLTGMEWEAEDFSWGTMHINPGSSTGGYASGIGLIGSSPYFSWQQRVAVYDLNVSHAGSWKLEIRRAALDARPCKLFVNGILVSTDGAGGTTGGWYPEHQQWKDEGTFSLRAGVNEIRIERYAYFPPIDKIRLTPQFGVAVDQDKFEINSQTGELTLKAVPDFETPQDANTDNVYEVDVVATDGKNSVSQRVMVYVGDIDEPTIVLNGQNVINHQEGMPFNDPGAYWVHPTEGTGSVIPSGEVRVMEVGEYKLNYNHSDIQGNQAVEKIRLVRIENQPPTGLSISSDQVEENLPIGARVGVLKTRDPGDPDGRRSYNYELIDKDDARAFTLDSDGTLRTAIVFDFENKNKYSIRVRTTDQFGGSFEKELTIRIVDSFLPIVETRGVVDLNGSGYQFSGEVLDEGGISGILEKGFVWSGNPRPVLEQNGSFKISSNGSGLKFNKVVKDLMAAKKYFFRAYARNKEGVGYGSVLNLRSAQRIFSPRWINAKPGVAANWWTSSWLGSFYMNDANASWIMHSEMGWLYPMESPKSGVWLWKEDLGWLWTDEAFYPFLYQNTSGSWLYFYGASQGTMLFYHYRDERWLQMVQVKLNKTKLILR